MMWAYPTKDRPMNSPYSHIIIHTDTGMVVGAGMSEAEAYADARSELAKLGSWIGEEHALMTGKFRVTFAGGIASYEKTGV